MMFEAVDHRIPKAILPGAKILLVGNSFIHWNGGLDSYLSRFGYIAERFTRPGATLQDAAHSLSSHPRPRHQPIPSHPNSFQPVTSHPIPTPPQPTIFIPSRLHPHHLAQSRCASIPSRCALCGSVPPCRLTAACAIAASLLHLCTIVPLTC